MHTNKLIKTFIPARDSHLEAKTEHDNTSRYVARNKALNIMQTTTTTTIIIQISVL
jgi:hypothetical protein